MPTSHDTAVPPHQWCAFCSLLETGFLSSSCQDFETLFPSRRKGKIWIHPQRVEETAWETVMALWISAAVHASHSRQLSSAWDLAEEPHDALMHQCAVQHRDSGDSFAPQETSSITDCNDVKHDIAVLHRRCARVCHIFQDISGKRLGRACSPKPLSDPNSGEL